MNVEIYMKYIGKIRENKTLVNGMFFSIFAFAGRGISFVLLVVLASYIPPIDYGKLSLFNTVIMLLGFFMTFSTSGYLGISFFKEDKNTFHQDFTFIMLMLILTGVLFSIFFWIIGEELSDLAGISYGLLWWALLIAFVNVPFQMHMDYYRLQENVKMYGIMNLGNAILNAILSLLLVITFAQGWMGRVNAHIWLSVVFAVIAAGFFVKNGFFDFHLKKERMKKILFWGIPLIPHLTTTWIKQGCDQYIINYNYTTQEVGLFSFSLNLVGIITMIGMAFNSSNSVTIAQILSDNHVLDKTERLRKNIRIILGIYLGTTTIIVVAGCIFVPTFLPKYTDCIPYFMILSVYGFMVCLYYLYCNFLFYYGYTKKLMFITFGTSLFHLCLSLSLTQFSLYYTTIIYVISQMLCVLMVYIESQRILRKVLIK